MKWFLFMRKLCFLYPVSWLTWYLDNFLVLSQIEERERRDPPRKILFQSAGVEPRNLLVFFLPQTTLLAPIKKCFSWNRCEEISHAYVPLLTLIRLIPGTNAITLLPAHSAPPLLTTATEICVKFSVLLFYKFASPNQNSYQFNWI